MNTSYLGGEWYIDEMKTKANKAPGVPFSLPKSKYTFVNDWVPVYDRVNRSVDIKEVMDFIRTDHPDSKIKMADGSMVDYIPTKRIALPVNKENAIASGIVAEKDRDKMVDTVYINLRKNSIDKNQLMILDMLANFDWKRPIYMTQVYILQDFGLMDSFARVAKELLRQDRAQEAVELLDLGLERMPTWQIRFTDTNTYPFLEAYYAASAMGVEEAAAKGDALLREYAQTLIEYIEYYLRFEGTQGDMVSPILDEKLDQLGDIYYLATYAGRKEVVAELNTYYRSFGVSEDNLVDVGDKPRQADTTLIPKGMNE